MSSDWLVPAGAGLIHTVEELETLLCVQRGVGEEEKNTFFAPQYETAIHDPHELFEMEAAVDRIYHAAKKGEKILVYGDYDVDGMSSTAIVVETLHRLGAHVMPYLPHRMDDGYGINRSVLEQFQDEFDLLISVDCGVSNGAEIAWLKEQGKDAIVVDHHEIPEELPAARAVLHPRHPSGAYPWGHLSGAGVSFKLAQALLRDPRLPGKKELGSEKWLLDLAMLGTLGDVMPLQGENRAIVRFGMEILRLGKRLGLRSLADAARVSLGSVNAETVAFRLIPLLNAAGRVDHPQAALNVLLASSSKRAIEAAHNLVMLNKQRQALTRKITREAENQVDIDSPVMFASNLEWPAGIVGLVAGGLSRKFGKPAVVVGGNGQHGVGSARTSHNVNILNALQAASEHTLRLGGHAQAAGFSIEEARIQDFYEAVCEHWSNAESQVDQDILQNTADAVISDYLLSWETHRLLKQFEPFGKDNESPRFAVRDLAVIERRNLGKEGQHLKYRLALSEGEIDAIGFGLSESISEDISRVDVVGSLDVNTFRDTQSLQIRIEDAVKSGSVTIKEQA